MFVNVSLCQDRIHLQFFEVLTMVVTMTNCLMLFVEIVNGEESCSESMAASVGVGLGRLGYFFGRRRRL